MSDQRLKEINGFLNLKLTFYALVNIVQYIVCKKYRSVFDEPFHLAIINILFC